MREFPEVLDPEALGFRVREREAGRANYAVGRYTRPAATVLWRAWPGPGARAG